jgi:hypothetical protein
MKNENYDGFVTPVPAHLNPKSKSNLFAFSGAEISRGDPFAALFQILNVPGFVSPLQFAADLAASGKPPRLAGRLELFAPYFVLGQFTYIRADGTTATARAEDSMELSPPELLPPTRTPSQPKPRKPSPPPPPVDDTGDMSF